MQRMLFALIIFAAQLSLPAQQIDTTRVEKVINMEETLDSLRQQIRAMDGEIQRMKGNMVNKAASEVNELLGLFGEEPEDVTPEDQRSRRKRVDAMLRAISQRPGQLRFNGGLTSTLQNNVRGDDGFPTGVGSFDIFAHTAFGQHTLLFIDFEAIGGDGPNSYINAFSDPNGDSGSQHDGGIDELNVLEAWTEFTTLDGAINVTAGKIDLTNYFDNNAYANDETSQFLSSGFVNSSALPAPANAPGIRLRTTVLNRFFIQAGFSSVYNSGDNLFSRLFRIGSVGFKVLPNTAWESNLRFYGYLHPLAENSSGGGLSFDSEIFERFKLFARYTKNSFKLAEWFGIETAWSAGVGFEQLIFEREFSIGFAYGETRPFEHSLKHERFAEFYAKHQLNQWVYLSPHVQLVQNAAGSDLNYTIVGLRTHFNY